MTEQQVGYEQAEAMGISHEAYDEVLDIVGRIPSMDELSTLLAMWESNGRQQSLYGWLRGQRHTVQRDEYLYSGNADHKAVREPKVKDCLELAYTLCTDLHIDKTRLPFGTGSLLYLVGNVSSEFADGEYARKCLHLVETPMVASGSSDECQYVELIVGALESGGLLTGSLEVSVGGLFCSLLRFVAPMGYDILAPREIRLDAFLFGEAKGRYVVALREEQDDQFLLKMDEARLNCCFLGRTTKNRIVVDGYDFGPASDFILG